VEDVEVDSCGQTLFKLGPQLLGHDLARPAVTSFDFERRDAHDKGTARSSLTRTECTIIHQKQQRGKEPDQGEGDQPWSATRAVPGQQS
jgi:hypothetical protein